MKIAIAAWGTTGDVYPLIALAERLQKRQHQIRLCAPSIYQEKISEIGADFHEVGTTFDLEEFHNSMDTLLKMRDPIAPLMMIAKEGILRHGQKWFNDCLAAMEGFDLVICHSIDIPAQEAAVRLGLGWITVTYCPGFIKTPDNTPHPLPNLGRLCNSIIWKIVGFRLKNTVDPLFNEFIVSIGGKPRSSVASDKMYSPHLNLIAASPAICAPANLSSNHKYTGIWYLAQPDYVPPKELTTFLENGPSPIIVTFGSMGGSDGEQTTQIIVDAIKQTNQRAVIQAGWGLLGSQSVDKDIFCTDYVPHRWLFPQASCVVHHGGAGTTASVCYAKVPSIVVPHIADQFYWGKRLFDLGVAPRSLPRRNLTAKGLAKRIEKVLSAPVMKEKVKTLGVQMESENGLACAVEMIESFPIDKR